MFQMLCVATAALFRSIEISCGSLCAQLDFQQMNPVATDSCATISWFEVLRRSRSVCEVDLFSSLSPGPRQLQNTSKNVILYANPFFKGLEPVLWFQRQAPDLIGCSRAWCCCGHATDALIACTDWLQTGRLPVCLDRHPAVRQTSARLSRLYDWSHSWAFKRTALKPITSSEIVQKKVPLRMIRIMLEWRGVFMVL